MKQRIPSTIYSKEFREQAVKQVTEVGLPGAVYVPYLRSFAERLLRLA